MFATLFFRQMQAADAVEAWREKYGSNNALWGQNRNSEQIAALGRIPQKSVKLHAPKRKMFSGT